MTTITAHKLPKAAAPVLFAFYISASLGGVMSAMTMAINTGLEPGFLGRWLQAYALAFALACPSVTLIAPIVRRFVDQITN